MRKKCCGSMSITDVLYWKVLWHNIRFAYAELFQTIIRTLFLLCTCVQFVCSTCVHERGPCRYTIECITKPVWFPFAKLNLTRVYWFCLFLFIPIFLWKRKHLPSHIILCVLFAVIFKYATRQRNLWKIVSHVRVSRVRGYWSVYFYSLFEYTNQ